MHLIVSGNDHVLNGFESDEESAANQGKQVYVVSGEAGSYWSETGIGV
jgi:hypothetical protein